MTELAIDGGDPVREENLPYGSQSIDEQDAQALLDVLGTDWLTTGPKVDEFEGDFADCVDAAHGVAVSNGTAALHTAMRMVGVDEGDEVIVPPMTFAATANAVLFEGATPVFTDIEPGTLLLDPEHVKERITSRTKAIITVDYTGHPSRYDALREICTDHELTLVSDACHALGAEHRDRPVGSIADASCFSFHPVKHITTGEGGMVTTDREEWAKHGRRFRHHGMRKNRPGPKSDGDWTYEIDELGQNYRLTDLHCSLGISQLAKLDDFVERRREIAERYDRTLEDIEGIVPLEVLDEARHSYHLYVVRVKGETLGTGRRKVVKALQAEGIGVNVHYIPVHLQPYYRRTLGTKEGLCPVSEAAYQEILSLPIFPGMTDTDVSDVERSLEKIV